MRNRNARALRALAVVSFAMGLLACGDESATSATEVAGGDGLAADGPRPPPRVALPTLPSVCEVPPEVLLSVDDAAPDPSFMAVVGDEVFVLLHDNETLYDQVHAVSTAGGSPRRLTAVVPGVIGFWVEGENVLFSNVSGLFRVPIEGGVAETVMEHAAMTTRSTVLDASYLYWLDIGSEEGAALELWRRSRTDGHVEQLWQKLASPGSAWNLARCTLLDGPEQLYVAVDDAQRQYIAAVHKGTGSMHELLTLRGYAIPVLLTATKRAIYFPHPALRLLFELESGERVPEAVSLVGLSEEHQVTAARATADGSQLFVGVQALFADESKRPVVVRVGEKGGQVEFVGCLGALDPSRAHFGEAIRAVVEDDDAVYVWGVDGFRAYAANLYRFRKGP